MPEPIPRPAARDRIPPSPERAPAIERRWRSERATAALVLAAVAMLVYGPSLIGGELVGGADVVRSAYPIRLHFWSIVHRVELPTWSASLLGGYPIVIEEQASPFYPPEWLFGALRSPAAYNLLIALHTWLAGFGAYLLARRLHLSRLAAWMLAVTAMFGAPLVARVAAGHPSHLYGRAWMIWALLGILSLAEAPGGRTALALGCVYGAQVLIGIGNYQTALYTGVLSAVFGLYVLVHRVAPRSRSRFVGWGLVACALAVGFGACRAGITLDVGLQSTRQAGLTPRSLDYGALPPVMLTGYFLPHTFDDPSILDYTWPEFALYVGSAPFVLATYAVLRRWREPAVRWWILITLLFVILSLGTPAGLFSFFADLVPGYAFFRNPARHGMVASLGVTLLAGYGLDALVHAARRVNGKTRSRRVPALALGMVVCASVLALASTYAEPSGASIQVLPVRALRGAVWFAAATCLFYLAFRLHAARPTASVARLMIGAIALDLVLYAVPQVYQGTLPARLPYLSPAALPGVEDHAVAFLETADTPDWGLVNVAADNGVRLLNMYTGVIPQRTIRTVNVLTGRPASAPQEENTILLDAIARPDLLDLLGVRYLLAGPGIGFDSDPSLRAVGNMAGLVVWSNDGARPLGYLSEAMIAVDSPEAALAYIERTEDLTTAPVAVEGDLPAPQATCARLGELDDSIVSARLEGGSLRFDVTTSRSGMLVLNQTYLEGWKAWIDETPTAVYPVNYRWIGVYVPCPGEHALRLRYAPPSLTLGLVISAATGVLVVTALLVSWRRRRAAPGTPLSGDGPESARRAPAR